LPKQIQNKIYLTHDSLLLLLLLRVAAAAVVLHRRAAAFPRMMILPSR